MGPDMNERWTRFRARLRTLTETIWGPQRVEITVESEQLYIIHRRSSQQSRIWCEKCGHDVEVVDLAEAKTLADASQLMLPDGAVPEAWHVCAEGDKEPFICLESLLTSRRSRT